MQAAIDVFVEKGFSGAAISDIAKKAGVNQSLIYHHVGNKKDLWQKAKNELLDLIPEESVGKTSKTFCEFVETVVYHRIDLYKQHPKLLRLIQWQGLEAADNFQASHPLSPTRWADTIKRLQQVGEVKNEYPASLIALHLHSLIQGVLLNTFDLFTQHEALKKEIYIRMVIKETVRAFSV